VAVATPGAIVRESAHEYWGAKVAEYDDFIRRVVPRYDEMMDRLLEGVPPTVERVLELGSGTGNLSLRLAALAPEAHFTFVDASPEMVEALRTRLSVRAPAAVARSTFVVAGFETFVPDPGAWDLVVSSLSLHHVADLGPVYRRIGAALRPRGQFRSCDGVRAATAEQERIERARWEAFWLEGSRLTPEELASVREHVARHDHYETLETHFRLLAEAGLTAWDCAWRDGRFAVLSAKKGDEVPSG
jgi:tRNA (cmo5U34)-methyltransferase